MMNIADLRPHPRQTEFNPPPSAAEDKALQDDLDQNGQRDPIDVMPPGNAAGLAPFTILDGHRRVKTQTALGRTNVTVRVRHDLKDVDAAAVDVAFLNFNRVRRQYDPLSYVINLKAVWEARKKVRPGKLPAHHRQALAQEAASALGKNLRHAQRYIHVAHSSVWLQGACRKGLNLALASSVDCLSQKDQHEIDQMIQSSASTKEIAAAIRMHVDRNQRPGKVSVTAVLRFIRALNRFMPAIRDVEFPINQECSPLLAKYVPQFAALASIARKLLTVGKKAKKKPAATVVHAESADPFADPSE